jgi:hypothetical protein
MKGLSLCELKVTFITLLIVCGTCAVACSKDYGNGPLEPGIPRQSKADRSVGVVAFLDEYYGRPQRISDDVKGSSRRCSTSFLTKQPNPCEVAGR